MKMKIEKGREKAVLSEDQLVCDYHGVDDDKGYLTIDSVISSCFGKRSLLPGCFCPGGRFGVSACLLQTMWIGRAKRKKERLTSHHCAHTGDQIDGLGL